MKKFLSLLLALSLVLGMSLTATAATSGQLVDGDNEIELPWDTDEASVFTYTATQTGTLYISVEEFYSCDPKHDYSDNSQYMNEWTDYTNFTVDGQALSGGYFGGVEVVEGQTYTVVWEHIYATEKWYNLGWKAVINLSYSGEAVPQPGSEELPVELYVADCPTDTIEIPAGGTVWYLLYDFGGAQFTVTGDDAYVVMTVRSPETLEQEEVTIPAKDGVVTVSGAEYHMLIQIGNAGDAPAVFALDYYYPLGSAMNPEELKLGQNTATVEEENYDGYNFLWVAECAGTLTLTMPKENWMASIENITAGTGMMWYDSSYDNVLTVEVSAGDEVLINVNYFEQKTTAFPGGTVVFTAEVQYTHEFVDGVCSHCGAEEEGQGGQDPVTVGDVNGDGRINARDARALLRLVAGLAEEGEANEAAADVNGDGRVNARDARTLLRQIAGLE